MNHLQVTLEAPDVAAAGEPVAYAVVIRNIGSQSLDLHLQGREPIFDLRVTDEAGVTAWRRLEGQSVQAILRLDTLDPGESMTLEDVWGQRDASGRFVAPGLYTLQAEVPTDAQSLMSQTRPLRVVIA